MNLREAEERSDPMQEDRMIEEEEKEEKEEYREVEEEQEEKRQQNCTRRLLHAVKKGYINYCEHKQALLTPNLAPSKYKNVQPIAPPKHPMIHHANLQPSAYMTSAATNSHHRAHHCTLAQKRSTRRDRGKETEKETAKERNGKQRAKERNGNRIATAALPR